MAQLAQSESATLLFTDVVNSTAQLQQAGDEISAHLFQAHHKLMSEAIAAAGGEELQWLGDGLLAAFSSTANAVRCAIVIQQTARRPTAGARFEIRIGIQMGELLRRDGGYFGTPVVTARRLCDRASSGQILCSRLVADLLSARGTFNFRDLGAFELEGIGVPVGVCEVVYERNDPIAMLNRTPFVGRAAQLDRLSAKLADAANGRGSIAMLRGEPGIGKTRALQEFADCAPQHGAVVLCGSCYEGESQAPYGPFAEAIVNYARIAPMKFANAIGKRAAIIARIAPALRELVDIPELVSLDKEEERFRLFDAVSQFFIDVSRQAPLVLVLDDLHWADRGTVAMLSHVARYVSNNSILLIGAYRDAEVDRRHPMAGALASLNRSRNFESFTFKGLDRAELAQLLEMVGDQNAPDALVKALEDATDGNPLFIREVLLHLLEEGKLLHEARGWMAEISVDELNLPEGVRQVITRRLMRLSEDTNQLLKVASAFNGAFSIDIAASVAGLDEDAALSAIDAALEAQLLRPGVHADSFDFTHAVIRHTLYAGLNSARRVRLHRKIAEEMERAWGEKTTQHAAEVAYQFWRGAAARGTERGATYAIAAADNAEAAYDHYEVAAFLRIALDLIPENDPKRPRLLARLSFALTWALNGDEALKVAQEAGERIAATEGSPSAAEFYERIARAMFGAGITRGAWQLAKEGLRLVQGRHDITWASLTEIDINRAEGEDSSNPGILLDSPRTQELCEVLRTLPREQLAERNIDPIFFSRKEILEDPSPCPRGLWRGGNMRLTLSLHRENVAECERRGAILKAMTSWAGIARCQIALGDFVEAQAALDRAAAMSTRIGQPSFGSMTVAGVRTELYVAMNENWEQLFPDIRSDLGQSDASMGVIEFLKAQGPEALEIAGARAYSACIHAFMGDRERALQELNELIPAIEDGAGWAIGYTPMALFAARIIWVLNSTAHADLIERNIRKKVLAPDFRWTSGDSRLALAQLCALQGRYDEAVEWFAKAREVLDEQGARPLRAMADYDEGLMYLRRRAPGDSDRARPFFEEATRRFRLLGMTGWIKSAETAAEMIQKPKSEPAIS